MSSALQGAVPEIEWSHQRGLVAEPFQLSLTSEPEASIFYTTDGSAPSPESAIYSEPLQIDKTTILRAIAIANGETTSVETHSFLFIDQVANQEATPEGFPMQIVSGRNGPDRPHTFDWAMDPEVLDDVANNGDIVEHLQDIPTLSVVMELKDLNFLFENQTRRGVDYERATSLELIYPNKEACAEFGGFQIDCGARMQGGGAGDQARKKSLRILFKKDYGKGSLKYPLFESAVHFGGNGESSFDGIVLRAGGNTNWSKDDAWKHEPSTYLRDPFVRDSQIAISGMGSRSVFVHLYINGLYFGLYNIAERPDEKFISSYMGGDVEDFYAINHGGTVNGDASYWDDTVSSSSLRNLDQPDRYENIRERIDVEAYCDYV
ncbi:MAG: chitobiase/beta-hexosaminidase C-terminal domain-containing protein, partial [Verrucomicrobiales bacterium]